MNKTKTLKETPEVTALAATDQVLVTDSAGKAHRISKANLLADRVRFNGTGAGCWVRVAKFFDSAGCLLAITSNWYSKPVHRILADSLLHSNQCSYCHMSVLSSGNAIATPMNITKARVVASFNKVGYIDIYCNMTSADTIIIDLINSLNVTLMTPVVNAEVPDGYSTKEFDLTQTAWGG
ncbi:hypothetical protein E4T81_06355 [Barnesiella sp. WM24]|uniref:hypothetical protein n=1 Tax=Barnesiella sp. WM24 TaxID=2558278 RepID=UPI001071CBC8|nr:hypothetical protein [Barnesiella sp. WM24]TFU93575.1 hypothetical protein E4T81_06355 [Barnesiella sp. WM24]